MRLERPQEEAWELSWGRLLYEPLWGRDQQSDLKAKALAGCVGLRLCHQPLG